MKTIFNVKIVKIKDIPNVSHRFCIFYNYYNGWYKATKKYTLVSEYLSGWIKNNQINRRASLLKKMYTFIYFSNFLASVVDRVHDRAENK